MGADRRSLGILALAGLAGRWFCRRVLSPVTRMAASARQMGVDPGQRLPFADTGDELADLGIAFNTLLGRLHESFERQRRFTGDASHQLRTPLTGMLGQVEVALRHERSSEEYRQTLRALQAQALRLRGIVETLLFLARADADATLANFERVDLVKWLRIHLESWREHVRSTDICLEAPSNEPLWVEAQTTLLGQLVDNLLDNACKYSEAGSRITLKLWRDPAGVALAIHDKGAGIPKGELPRIFEPFYRSLRTRRAGTAGVGLGLAIARRIAAALHGQLEVSSEPGHGTSFALRVPSADGALTAPTDDADCSGGDVHPPSLPVPPFLQPM